MTQGVILSFEYSVTLSSSGSTALANNDDNFVEILARFGVKDLGPNGVVDTIEASNSNVITSTGVRRFQVDVGPRKAGTSYPMTLGAFLNHKEGVNEYAKICFSSVTVEATFTSS